MTLAASKLGPYETEQMLPFELTKARRRGGRGYVPGGDATRSHMSLRGRGSAGGASFRTSLSGRTASPLHFVLPLLLFLFSSSALSQDLAFTTRLSPWPPEGWPEGAQGEVRLGAATPELRLVTFLSFPVSETGEVTYRLPEALPEGAEALYRPASVDLFAYCPG